MVLTDLKIKHKTFGEGTVVSFDGRYITVSFLSCEKKFVYPDAFESFITLGDGSVSDEILEDIKNAKMAKQIIIDKKNEENRRAMDHGIVIPGKETGVIEVEE
jgi:hypothetical protein